MKIRLLATSAPVFLAGAAFSAQLSANSYLGISPELINEIILHGGYVRSPRVVYPRPPVSKTLTVTATAYTSHANQTDSTPNIAAWGDRLAPGMKAIAVSRDLLHEHGLTRGSRVKIQGLPGHYLVLDKMNKRWRRKIDIYMGKDRRKAFRWGKKKVTIEWSS